ncbi:MAG: TonB-dependent receptor [Deltaproteobacteria bacterium]|nr:TonB-dependent receptor [Deltaproteobacteria bacterium]
MSRSTVFAWSIRTGILAMVCVFLVIGTSGPVFGEESTEDYVLEDTVVTATKTGETQLQETPMTISVFDDQTLTNTQSYKLSDLSQFMPNVEIHERFGPTAFIRGIGSILPPLSGDHATAFYLDGVYLDNKYGFNADFFDIERIEVLRGPQGTLYGRNATAGAINIITKAPSDKLEIRGGVELGEYQLRRFDMTISGPIVANKVKARFTVSDTQRDGYVENLIGEDLSDDDYTSLRGKIQFTPTEKLDIVISGDYSKVDENGKGWKLLSDQGLFGMLGYLSGLTREQMIHPDFWTVAQPDEANGQKDEGWGVSGKVTIDLPNNMVLHSITAYREYDWDNTLDLDGYSVPLGQSQLSVSYEQFSQELQLNGTWGRWNWVAGLYYLTEEEDSPVTTNALSLNYFFPGFVWKTGTLLEMDAYAVFGDLKYALTDRLTLGVGLRYSYEEKTFTYISDPNIPVPPFFTDSVKVLEDDWDELTPRFGLDYQLTDDVLLYANIVQGFRSGALEPTNLPGEETIEPEILWSYELGAKSDWFDNRLRANMAIFYYDYQDLQVNSVVSGQVALSNAATSTVYGAELEFLARPLPALTLNGSFAWLDSEYDEFITRDEFGFDVDASGHPLPFSPEWKISVGAQYVFTLGDLGFLTFRGDLSWKDDAYLDSFKRSPQMQEAYTLVDGLVRFETTGGRWSAEVYGKNLTDEEYLHSAVTWFLPSDATGLSGDPQMFGFKLGFNY